VEKNTSVHQDKLINGTGRFSYVMGRALCDVSPCPHPGTDIGGRCFRLNVGRTVLSSNTNTDDLAEADPRNEVRRLGRGPATA
jgi:hypothetical protein